MSAAHGNQQQEAHAHSHVWDGGFEDIQHADARLIPDFWAEFLPIGYD